MWILELLLQLRWTDVVDVTILTLIFYRFLLILRGTRALEMLVGISFLIGLTFLASSLGLQSLDWLLKYFFENSVIILFIIFQDQIRSALASFSTVRIFKSGRKNDEMVIEEVIESVFRLSKHKTGALIAMERHQGLRNYSQTGTRLDAKLHADVIISIFQLSSPLHDGAIVIHDGLIQSAGCFLPLSKNNYLDRQFGTRHRAALGLTETTDAVVVVVSEETGKISLFADGQFELIESSEQLRSSFLKHFRDFSSRPLLESILS